MYNVALSPQARYEDSIVKNKENKVADIFDELKQDIEEERWLLLWKKYQNHVYGIVAAIIIASAGYAWHTNHKQSILAQMSERYFIGMNMVSNKSDRSLTAFDQISASGQNIYSTLARFWAASLLTQKGTNEKAAHVYDTIIDKNTGIISRWDKQKVLMKELAIFKKAYTIIDQANIAAVQKEIEPFAQKGNPWEYSAYEILGLLKLRENKKEEAASYFRKIVNASDASNSFKSRAETFLGTLNQE